MDQWGKDHWSTLAYIECCIVDKKGIPDNRKMRCSESIHPQFYHLHHVGMRGAVYPTQLRGGKQRHDHDDWSCLEDAEHFGLLSNIGTGVNPRFQLTPLGSAICGLVRRHKQEGGNFAGFQCLGQENNTLRFNVKGVGVQCIDLRQMEKRSTASLVDA